MGCLVSIFKKILIVLLIFAFFALGGYAFVKDKIQQYKYPSREVFIEQEKEYGNFARVSGDYQLYRSYNFFGYKKINAKYLPTGQKITIFDLNDEETISVSDFKTGAIASKISLVLEKLKDSFITYEGFEIVQQGTYQAKNKEIPFIKYTASVKNIPFKDVVGIIAAYSTKDKNNKPSTKLVFSVVGQKAFNPKIVQDFVTSLEFEAVDK